MFGISDDPFEEQIQPPPSASGMHREDKQQVQISNDNQTRPQSQNDMGLELTKTEEKKEDVPTGCTKFCKLNYYKQYFNIGENQVKSRLKASITVPPTQDFIQRTDGKPDLYGPFWILTTILFLVGFIGNFSNYLLSKFSYSEVWDSYFFKLEHIRYGFGFLYPFGFVVPTGFFFLFKFLDKNMKLSLPDVLCVYGYSLTVFIPVIAACIIPLGFLQWIFILAGAAVSGFFLFKSLKNHLEGVSAPMLGVILGVVQLLFAILLKKIFLNLLE